MSTDEMKKERKTNRGRADKRKMEEKTTNIAVGSITPQGLPNEMEIVCDVCNNPTYYSDDYSKKDIEHWLCDACAVTLGLFRETKDRRILISDEAMKMLGKSKRELKDMLIKIINPDGGMAA